MAKAVMEAMGMNETDIATELSERGIAGLDVDEMSDKFGGGMLRPPPAASKPSPSHAPRRDAGRPSFPHGKLLTRQSLIAAEEAASDQHSDELMSAVAALEGLGSDADVRGMYEMLRLVEGTSRHVFLRSPGPNLIEDLRSRLQGKLKPFSLTISQFKALVARFEKAFCVVAVADASAGLVAQRTLARQFLDDAPALKALALRMFGIIEEQTKLANARVPSATEGQYTSPSEQRSLRDARKRANREAMRRFVEADLPFANRPEFKEEVLEELMESPRPGKLELLEALLRRYIDHRLLPGIERTQQSLLQEPKRALSLAWLVEGLKNEFGIAPGSAGELFIEYAQRDASELNWDEKLKYIAMAALGATAMLFPGTAVGAGAVFADAGIGAHDVGSSISRRRDDRGAYFAGLGADPSLVWVVLSMIGAGLSLYGATRFLRGGSGTPPAAVPTARRITRAETEALTFGKNWVPVGDGVELGVRQRVLTSGAGDNVGAKAESAAGSRPVYDWVPVGNGVERGVPKRATPPTTNANVVPGAPETHALAQDLGEIYLTSNPDLIFLGAISGRASKIGKVLYIEVDDAFAASFRDIHLLDDELAAYANRQNVVSVRFKGLTPRTSPLEAGEGEVFNADRFDLVVEKSGSLGRFVPTDFMRVVQKIRANVEPFNINLQPAPDAGVLWSDASVRGDQLVVRLIAFWAPTRRSRTNIIRKLLERARKENIRTIRFMDGDRLNIVAPATPGRLRKALKEIEAREV